MTGKFDSGFFTEQHLSKSVLAETNSRKPAIYISYVCISQSVNDKYVVTKTQQYVSFNETGKVHMSETLQLDDHSVKFVKDINEDGTTKKDKQLTKVSEGKLAHFLDVWNERAANIPQIENFVIDNIPIREEKPKREAKSRMETSRSNVVFNVKKKREVETPEKPKPVAKKAPATKKTMRSVSPAPRPVAAVHQPVPKKDSDMIIASHEEELDCLRQVNEYREKNGMQPLTWNSELRSISLPHTIAMFKKEVPVDHTGFKERCEKMPDVSMGENVGFGAGSANAIKKMMIGWIRSLHHRSNILGKFNSFGVTFAHRRDGDWYGTQLFAFIPTGRMRDATVISREDRKELLIKINTKRRNKGVGPLRILTKAQEVHTKHARRICCGKINFGDGTIDERSKLIFGDDEPYAYGERIGRLSIIGKDATKEIMSRWFKDDEDENGFCDSKYTHVALGIAYNEQDVYTYSVALIKLA